MNSLIGRLLSDVGIAVPVVIVGGGIATIYGVGLKWYRRTIGSRRDLARRLNDLACGVTLRYVEERFGTPAFARLFELARPLAAQEVPRRQPARDLIQLLAGPSGTPAARLRLAPGPSATADGKPAKAEPLREFIYREKHAGFRSSPTLTTWS